MSSNLRPYTEASNIPRGMWTVAAALVPHELPPEVQIRLVLIVGAAAQRDIARLMLSTFPVGILVMVLHRARAPAAATLLIDERATTPVALPHLASDRGRDGARSSVATPIARPIPTSIATLIATSISAARWAGDRGLLRERILE
ncbi:MAG: hypothetical protein V3R77_05785 [Candidatus Binatia bacterium]